MCLPRNIVVFFLISCFFCSFGQGWERIDVGADTGSYFSTIDFVNEQVGFIAGDGGILRKTVDGGATWEPISIGHYHNISDIEFLNSDVGFACDISGYIYRTVDGGLTWGTVVAPQRIEYDQIYDMSFYDDMNGIAVGRSGFYFITSDGGATWSRGDLGLYKYIKVSYFAEDTILATSGSGTLEGQIALSVDGGANWSKTLAARRTFFDFARNGSRIFLVGSNVESEEGQSITNLSFTPGYGQVLQSVDVDTVVNSALTGIHFVDSELGYAVGQNGVILKTINGGNNWMSESSGVSSTLSSISRGGTSLFAIGAGGVVLTLKLRNSKIVSEKSTLFCPNEQVVLRASQSTNIHWESMENPGVVLSRDSLFTINLNTPFGSYTLLEDSIPVDTFQVLGKPLEMCPIELKVYELITPNDDGFNDTWDIDNIEYLISSEVFVYDSWGKEVFNEKNYKNTWSGNGLANGEYVYVVNDLDRNKTYTGKLYLKN